MNCPRILSVSNDPDQSIQSIAGIEDHDMVEANMTEAVVHNALKRPACKPEAQQSFAIELSSNTCLQLWRQGGEGRHVGLGRVGLNSVSFALTSSV